MTKNISKVLKLDVEEALFHLTGCESLKRGLNPQAPLILRAASKTPDLVQGDGYILKASTKAPYQVITLKLVEKETYFAHGLIWPQVLTELTRQTVSCLQPYIVLNKGNPKTARLPTFRELFIGTLADAWGVDVTASPLFRGTSKAALLKAAENVLWTSYLKDEFPPESQGSWSPPKPNVVEGTTYEFCYGV
jgi:hypothetical protein